MEPISALCIYTIWIVVGSGIIYYVSDTVSIRIYNNIEHHMRND